MTRGFENGLAGFWRDFVDAWLLLIFPFVVPTTLLNGGDKGMGGGFNETVKWT